MRCNVSGSQTGILDQYNIGTDYNPISCNFFLKSNLRLQIELKTTCMILDQTALYPPVSLHDLETDLYRWKMQRSGYSM